MIGSKALGSKGKKQKINNTSYSSPTSVINRCDTENATQSLTGVKEHTDGDGRY